MAFLLKKTLQSYLRMNRNYQKVPYLFRTLTTSNSLTDNYEGDGKTTVTILNKEHKNLIMIDSYSTVGFRLNNGIFTMGPLATFPRTILQWNVENVEEMTPESLSLFCLLEPKIDILVIGTGEFQKLPGKDVLRYLKFNKISAEILSTQQACATFNFLNSEGRCVAGAFIPPTSLLLYEEEIKLLEEVHAIDDYNETPVSRKIE